MIDDALRSIRTLLQGGDLSASAKSELLRIEGMLIHEVEILCGRALDELSVPVVLVDVLADDMPIVYVNRAFLKVTEYEEHEVLGKNCRFLQGPGADPAAREQVRRAIEQRRGCTVLIENFTKSGRRFWNQLSLSPISNAGEIRYYVGVQSDVTDGVERAHELEQLLLKERELNAAKSRFVTVVSHEFRTPLASIAISAGLVKDFGERLSADQRQAQLQNIKSAVTHLDALLDDVTFIARYDSGRKPLAVESTDISELLKGLVRHFQQIYPTSEIEYSHSGSVRASVDYKVMYSVLSNILSNALKYSMPRPRVRVFLDAGAASWAVEVRDNGIGIAEADIRRVFEPFERGSNVESRQGTGLGMSIVKTGVEAHRGAVSVHSTVGEGTVVRVVFPYNSKEGEKDVK